MKIENDVLQRLQKQILKTKSLALAIMKSPLKNWGKTILFIGDVKRLIAKHPGVCTIACKNKAKTEKILVDAGIPKDRVKLIGFPKIESQIKEVVFDKGE